MINKILGIFVCMLLVTTAFPVLGAILNNIKIKEDSDAYDSLIKHIGNRSNLIDWSEQVKLLPHDGAEGDRFGESVSIYGDYALVGALFDDDNGVQSGSAYVFKREGTSWIQEDKLIPSDGSGGDRFGESVSIYGDYALIGAQNDDNNKGSAYVFKRSGSNWVQEDKLTASDGAMDDYFGESVCIFGDYAIVGAAYDDDNGDASGSAYVFKRVGTSWIQEDKLTASDGEIYDKFGGDVSIDGDYALIGAGYDDNNKGSAYVFKRSGSNWVQEDKLTASDGAMDDYFGLYVSIDGDYAISGAVGDDDNGFSSGSAYVFKRGGSTWVQEDKLTASDGTLHNYFGRSVSIDGEYALIGAEGCNNCQGAAYVFKRDGSNWVEEDKLTASDGAADDTFGYSVSISGDYALAGAQGNNDYGYASGSAYIFNRESECCLVIENVSGGLLDSSGSLKVGAVIRNNGKGVCEDVNWSFNFSGGIVMMGQNKGLESTIPAGGTVTVYSKIVIGFSIPVLFPAFVTVTADAANNNCPPATMEKHVFLLFILLSVY